MEIYDGEHLSDLGSHAHSDCFKLQVRMGEISRKGCDCLKAVNGWERNVERANPTSGLNARCGFPEIRFATPIADFWGSSIPRSLPRAPSVDRRANGANSQVLPRAVDLLTNSNWVPIR